MIREIVKNWEIQATGDPFVDTGGMVIEYLQKKYPEKSIFQLIEMVTDF